jgi:hypothetical protein
MAISAAWWKNSHSHAAGLTKQSRLAKPRVCDLDPVKGLAVAALLGLTGWGLLGWLFWRLL